MKLTSVAGILTLVHYGSVEYYILQWFIREYNLKPGIEDYYRSKVKLYVKSIEVSLIISHIFHILLKKLVCNIIESKK